MKLGQFEVEPGCCPMVAGNFLKITMPDGRVVVVYETAVEPETVGGYGSLVEFWPSEDAYQNPSACDYSKVRQIGF